MNAEPMATVQCAYCNTTLSYPQNSLYIQCPKCQNTMNPAAPHASYVNCCGCNTLLSHPPTSLTIQCPKCFGDDTRILTQDGFKFIDELKAYEAAAKPLPLFACYDPISSQLVYSSGTLVFPPNTSGTLISFTSKSEAGRWNGEYVDDSNGLSLRVSPEHDMYVQLGNKQPNEQVLFCSKPHEKYAAETLLAQCDCPADADECLHRRGELRMVACATEGITGARSDSDLIDELASLELMNSVEEDAFLQLYGFWLGSGSILYGQTNDAVVFGQVKSGDHEWVSNQLQAAGLIEGQDFTSGIETAVTKPSWFGLFDSEYWLSYSEGRRRRGVDVACGIASSSTVEGELIFPGSSSKWWSSWVQRLGARRIRLMIDGLRRANGEIDEINTTSVSFRDATIHLAIHAGYSAYFTQSKDADADSWKICYNTPLSDAGKENCWPSMDRKSIKVDKYSGDLWCVNVHHPAHLVMVQRAERDSNGIVTKASRPVIAGQCLMVMDLPSRGAAGGMMQIPGLGDSQAGRKSRKKRKDPNAPKRATNAYMVFCRERRAQLKEERPDLPFGKLGAKLGEMWRLMTPEEKKPYELRASGDRDRYKAEMGSYQSANMLKGNAMSQLGLTDDSSFQHTKKVKLDDGSALGLDYSQLDPAQVELLQRQQQEYLTQLQQAQVAAVMQQAQQVQQQQQQQQQQQEGSTTQQYQPDAAASAATTKPPSEPKEGEEEDAAEEEEE